MYCFVRTSSILYLSHPVDDQCHVSRFYLPFASRSPREGGRTGEVDQSLPEERITEKFRIYIGNFEWLDERAESVGDG